MEQERAEVYERIPWETLEKQGKDRQWWVMALAAAIAVGALAYSFARNQPVAAPQPVAISTIPGTSATVPPATASVPTAGADTESPIAVAEADLYAVDPSSLADAVASHAEWFAVEYMSYDGSEQSATALAGLLPQGIPLPDAQGDVQVFVDWVGARSISETAPARYSVEVVVRSLASSGEGPFVRQPPGMLTIDVGIGPDGSPQVLFPPAVAAVGTPNPGVAELATVPDELRAQIETVHGPVVGGVALGDGRWKVVALTDGSDGVRRPVSVVVP